MKILTIETTCDETAAAVIDQDLQVLGSVVASQDQLHQRFGGVVPEIASRAHLERILPVIDQTLSRAGISLKEIDAVAVAVTPGLSGSLLVGLVAAKTLCLSLGVPLIAVNHLQAHIYACRISSGRDIFPCVGLIVSGGHTSLYYCKNALEFEPLGGTIDDAAGEAFDKVASMLGLPYPGGPAIGKAALTGNRTAYALPRAFIHDKQRLEFSFSGLKTAVRYHIVPPGTALPKQVPGQKTAALPASITPQMQADLAASFQEAVIDSLVAKTLLALQKTKSKVLCIGGGVAANQRLRERFTAECERLGIELHIPPMSLCTDNAVMGAIAFERYWAGQTEDLNLDIQPGLIR